MKKFASLLLSVLIVISLFGGCSDQRAEVRNDAATCDVVDFHTALQEKYINSPYDSIKKFAKGKKALNEPEPVILSWEDEYQVSQYTVNISESSDMSNAVSYSVDEPCVYVYNLKLDTQYYWNYSANNEVSDTKEFKTFSDCPRNIKVDGVKNVRDLGGWQTENGGKVNQGLLYRCARLNESSAKEPVIEITESGLKEMKECLGVKSEIDLRKANGETGAITESPLGEGVNYYPCPMQWEGDILLDNKQEILRVFEILSEESNYPVIFHCNIGTDRTGMVAFLVNALCGVSEEDLKRDYLFSNFADIGGRRTVSDMENSGYYIAVSKAEGKTLSERTYNCLLDMGVPSEQLDSVIRIMTE